LTNLVNGLPDSLDLQSIIPHKRDAWGEDYTVYNCDNSRFVVAFNVFEHTMMNQMGRFAWGVIEDGEPRIINHFKDLFLYCWEQPFAKWIAETTFVVKVAAKQKNHPLIAIDFEQGVQSLPLSGGLDSRPSHVEAINLLTTAWQSEDSMLAELK